jgi:phosphoribosylformimino-5-aminoimidazole carboxamide ribotide isomerase
MLILPAIDIHRGRTVRLRRGDFAGITEYEPSPVEAARLFGDAGLRYLHVVDLEGAREGRIVNWEAIADLLSLPGIAAEVGGGVRSAADIERLLGLGADRIVVGSVAVREPRMFGEWIGAFGPRRIALALDLRGGRAAVDGWADAVGDDPFALLASLVDLGVRTCICTDVDRDGMLEGPNLRLYGDLVARFPGMDLIASGGIASARDLPPLALTGVKGAIVGRAYYDGAMTLAEMAGRSDEG